MLNTQVPLLSQIRCHLEGNDDGRKKKILICRKEFFFFPFAFLTPFLHHRIEMSKPKITKYLWCSFNLKLNLMEKYWRYVKASFEIF